MGLGAVIASAIVMFASTNIDDALVLVVFFANAAEGKQGFQPRHVWIGQVMGFTVIMLISLIGVFVGSFLPPHYAGLLGFVPLLMGLWRTRHWCEKATGGAESSMSDAYQLQELSTTEGGRRSSIAKRESTMEAEGQGHKSNPIEERRVSSTESVADADIPGSHDSTTEPAQHLELGDPYQLHEPTDDVTEDGVTEQKAEWWSTVLSVHSLKMAAVTVANGGDNVAIYIPVLVTYNAAEVLLTVAIFYILLVAWLYVAAVFVSFRFVANFIEKYGHYIIPVALILLGVYILWSTDALSLL